MPSSSDSLSELERRAETTRAELAQTVDALHNRVSPAAIKADVKSYVRDNPLQAAAIAVAATYPAWRVIGAIPAPALLIGAGLAMARRGGGGMAGRDAPREGGVMETLKDKASGLSEKVTHAAQDSMEALRSRAAETRSEAAETLASTRAAASDTLHDMSERAGETYSRARDGMVEAIDRHPVLAGLAALAAGSLLAAAVALPALGILMLALAAFLHELGLAASLSYLITAVVGFAGAGVFAMLGMHRLKAEALLPNRTINQLHRDAATMKEHI